MTSMCPSCPGSCPGSSWPSQHHMPCHTWSQPWRLLGPDSAEEGMASVGRPLGSCVKLLRLQPRRPAKASSCALTFPGYSGSKHRGHRTHFSALTHWIYLSDPPQLLPAPVISPLPLQSTEQRPLLLPGCALTLGSKPVPRFR